MNDKPLTFHELVRRRQHAAFVGRSNEQAEFAEHLAKAPDDPNRYLIFNLHGQGGMGKTFLANRLADVARSQGHLVAWVDETARDAVEVMRAIVSVLPEKQAGPFIEQERTYRRMRHEVESDPDVPSGVTDLIARSVGQAGVRLGRHLPIAGLALEAVDEVAVGEQMAAAAAFLARKLANAADYELISSPLGQLTPLFIDSLNKTAQTAAIVVVFDTFEVSSQQLEPWLHSLLTGSFGALTPRLTLVFAGRDELDPNRWIDFTGVLASYELKPFVDEDAREYLRQRKVSQPAVIDEILELAQGMPLLLAMLAATSPGAALATDGVAETAVERFLKWTKDPRRRELALKCALPRVFNRDIVAALVPPGDDVEDAYSWVSSMPFAMRTRSGRHYHDVVRKQMITVLHTRSPETWQLVHDELCAYHEGRIKGATLTFPTDTETQQHLCEAWYHRLVCSSERTTELLTMICDLIARGDDLALLLADSMATAERDRGDGAAVGSELLSGIGASANKTYGPLRQTLLTSLTEHGQEKRAEISILRALATLAERAKNWPEAIHYLDTILTKDEGDRSARLSRVVARLGANESSRALEDLTTVIDDTRSVPDSAIVGLYVVRAELRPSEMAEDSLADLENAVERGGSEAELRPLRAKLLLSLKRFDEAAEESRRGLEDDSTSHRIREILLDALIESGNDTDAVEVGREAVRDDLACAKCWRRYAAALTQSSSATTAVDAMGSQTLERAEEFVARADAYASVEFLDHARADIDMALRLDERLAIAWRVRGVIEGMSVATMPLAVEAFSRALEIDEDEIFAYYLRASAHNALDNLAEAEADLAETIRRRPTFASAYIDRARIRAKRSKDGVEDDLDKAVELDETHLLERIDFFLKSSRFEEALRDQVALVKIRPSVDHRNGIGLTLSYLGFYDEAIELFEACLSDDEGIALPVQYNLTVATVRRDGVTGAASELKRLDDAIASAHGDVDEDRIGYAEAGAAALRGERSQAITRLSQTLSRDGRVAADWARRDPAWEALRLDADVRDLLTL